MKWLSYPPPQRMNLPPHSFDFCFSSFSGTLLAVAIYFFFLVILNIYVYVPHFVVFLVLRMVFVTVFLMIQFKFCRDFEAGEQSIGLRLSNGISGWCFCAVQVTTLVKKCNFFFVSRGQTCVWKKKRLRFQVEFFL